LVAVMKNVLIGSGNTSPSPLSFDFSCTSSCKTS
jgi:hypothetical protein